MKKITFIFLFFCTLGVAQEKDTNTGTKYLEDQIYLGLSYNIMNQRPDSLSSNGFSNGFFIGFIKDIPINKERNFGFGLGLGYGRNTYFQNLKITELNGITAFESLEGQSFSRNKFSLHSVEMPFEIRWRTSTSTRYKFWRVYTGIKFGYIFSSNAKLKQDSTIRVRGIEEVNKFQYGLTLAAGYGTWNVNVYYGINKVFSNATLTPSNEKIDIGELRIGLIFYIL